MNEWQTVPVEPTEEMRQAGLDAYLESLEIRGYTFVSREPIAMAYKAMLAAAPPADELAALLK